MESAKVQPNSIKNTTDTKGAKNTKKRLYIASNKSEPELEIEERSDHVAVSAYYKAQARGFEPGNELADWLASEAEVDSKILLH